MLNEITRLSDNDNFSSKLCPTSLYLQFINSNSGSRPMKGRFGFNQIFESETDEKLMNSIMNLMKEAND